MLRHPGGSSEVNVLGTRVSPLGLTDVLDRIEQAAAAGSKSIFDYSNTHSLNTAYETTWLRDFYNQCEVVFCDGAGVKLAAWLLREPIPERFSPPDWITGLTRQAADNKQTIFLLGGKDGVAKKAAEVLIAKTPGLEIVGTYHGYFDKRRDNPANQAVVELINRAAPDILIVGFGIPLQERWILENKSNLQVGVFLAAGALFDYISGEMRRAPRWMTDNGLEWLARLVAEPRRLWRRYVIGIPLFFIRVIGQRFGLLPNLRSET
ncbi:MAG: WecB/TagA/CpsF family glycosyltransferase [Anaerolineales bacterium]